jgi:protein-tyrosine phosphatase
MPYLLVTLLTLGGAAVIGLLLTRRHIEYPPPESYIIEPLVDIDAIRTADGAVEIRWHNPAATVEVYASTDPNTRGGLVARAVETNHVRVTGLDPALRHFFTLAFDPSTPDSADIRVAERIVPLVGAPNFRDLGGYQTTDGRRVRWGRVYRSGLLAHLTEADLTYLDALGVRIVCDFRSLEEIGDAPDRLPGDPGPEYVHLPVYIPDQGATTRSRLRALLFNKKQLASMMPTFYTSTLIDLNGAIFKSVFERLADPANLPAVIHCTAGKDRAGVTSALLLLALGVPESVVIADYSLSNRFFAHFREITRGAVAPLARLGITVDDLQPLLVADPDNLRTTLAHINEKYGSVADYLREGAHISDETINTLRANLLE